MKSLVIHKDPPPTHVLDSPKTNPKSRKSLDPSPNPKEPKRPKTSESPLDHPSLEDVNISIEGEDRNDFDLEDMELEGIDHQGIVDAYHKNDMKSIPSKRI